MGFWEKLFGNSNDDDEVDIFGVEEICTLWFDNAW